MKSRHYSPAISRFLVSVLYHQAKHLRIPMTQLVDDLLRQGLQGSVGWERATELTIAESLKAEWPHRDPPPPNTMQPSPPKGFGFFVPSSKAQTPMALKLVANYSKKIGLPEYSSHSFSVSLEVEITDPSQVEEECSRIYQLLQHSVDQEIQNVGFIPTSKSNSNGRYHPTNGSHHQNGTRQSNGNGDTPWNCTLGQKGLILKILNENKIEKQEAQNLSMQLFNLPVPDLNKMQASQLIEDLLVKAGKPAPRRWSRTTQTPT